MDDEFVGWFGPVCQPRLIHVGGFGADGYFLVSGIDFDLGCKRVFFVRVQLVPGDVGTHGAHKVETNNFQHWGGDGDPLPQMFCNMFSGLFRHAFFVLRALFRSLVYSGLVWGGRLFFGAGRSAIGMVSIVTIELYVASPKVSPIEFASSHRWSCERDSVVRIYAVEVSQPKQFAIEIADFCLHTVHCALVGFTEDICWVLEFVCGFSCTGVSRANMFSTKARNCIVEGTCWIGSIFAFLHCIHFILFDFPGFHHFGTCWWFGSR